MQVPQILYLVFQFLRVSALRILLLVRNLTLPFKFFLKFFNLSLFLFNPRLDLTDIILYYFYLVFPLLSDLVLKFSEFLL
jgi:hypothetical protein